MQKVSSKHLAEILLDSTDKLDEAGVKKSVKEFTQYLKSKKMLRQTPQIMENYRKLYDERHSIVEAEVWSQNRMSEATKDHLRSSLKERYKVKEAHILEFLDQRLIAGFKIKIGDEVYDGSVRGKLEALRQALIG